MSGMKTIYTLVFASLLFISCGGEKVESVEGIIATGDIKKIKAKKAEVETKQQAFADQLKMLNDLAQSMSTKN